MKPSKYDLRIARADHLAAQHPFAAQGLTFFRNISQLQARLYSESAEFFAKQPAEALSAISPRNCPPEAMLARFGAFVSEIERISPPPLAHAARNIRERSYAQWRELFVSYWQNEQAVAPAADSSEAALARMFLQPFAESLADQCGSQLTPEAVSVCPFCFEKPVVGALRPEGDGGKRFLICSMCATEWPCGRILCPACGEQNVEKLAVYSTDEFPHVRIEACDTCRFYLKTVDLTKTGRAVPVVDELATIPLNLWAGDHGYRKLETNLLGL
jgi:FdhE protein